MGYSSLTLVDKVLSGPFSHLCKEFVEQPVHTMSYGQRRTIELARAIAMEPHTLLLDEPFNYLDANRRDAFLEYLLHHKTRPRKVIMTSHYETNVRVKNSAIYEFQGSFPHSKLKKIK